MDYDNIYDYIYIYFFNIVGDMRPLRSAPDPLYAGPPDPAQKKANHIVAILRGYSTFISRRYGHLRRHHQTVPIDGYHLRPDQRYSVHRCTKTASS